MMWLEENPGSLRASDETTMALERWIDYVRYSKDSPGLRRQDNGKLGLI